MKLPFRRDNSENPVLMQDLESLSEAYRDGAGGPIPNEPSLPDPVAGAVIEDGYVRGFVRTAIHVRRYLPFYGVAAALALVLAVVSPITDGSIAPARELAQDAGLQRVNAGDNDTGDEPAGEALSAPGDVTVPAFSGGPATFDSADSSAGDGDSGSDFTFSPSPPAGSGSGPGTPSTTSPPKPQPLRITASGYASVSGGTPFDIEPADGALPVSAGAGEAGRISFLKVAGDDQKLRLQEADGSVNGEGASVRACLTTEDWTPERGMAMDDAPAYDAGHCSTGVRDSDGLWVFDLLTFADTSGFGLALVPGPGTAPPTFDMAFEPKALAASAASPAE